MTKAELQVQDFVPEEIVIALPRSEGVRVLIECDNRTLQEMADKTIFT